MVWVRDRMAQYVVMELVVLGCSGSVAGPESPASGYLLKNDAGQHLLMDCGPGVLGAMQRRDDIDPAACHIAFSHMHADHCLDFPSLLVWRRFHPHAPARDRHQLLGPHIAFEHLSHAGGDAPEKPDDFRDTFEVRAYSAATVTFDAAAYPRHDVGEFAVFATHAVHPTESYILRVHDSQGRSIVYSGDTGWTENLVNIATGADVLLCEATWGETSEGKPAGMHISGQDAGRAAAAAGVGTLVLTHIPPWGDKEATLRGAASAFDGEIIFAEPNLSLQI